VLERRAAVIAIVMLAAACTSTSSGESASDLAPPTPPSSFVPLPTLPESDGVVAAPGEEVFEWSALSSGSGGFVTGFDSNADGSVKLARTDVGGAYRWVSADRRWTPLLTGDGVAEPEPDDYQIEAMAIAPSDPDRLYLSVGATLKDPLGRVLVSSDGGTTWSSSRQRFVIFGNGDWRTSGERLAVHPDDPDTVLLGTRTEGLWRSTDAGQTFSRIEGVGVGENPTGADGDPAGVTWAVFAPDATAYVGVSGVGILRSTDGGATWNTAVSTDGMPFDAEVATDGRLWVAVRDPGQIWVVDGDNAVDVAPKRNVRYETVTVDPFQPDRALIGGVGLGNGDLYETTDGGDSWQQLGLSTSCPRVPWIDEYPFEFFPTGSFRFDRAVEGDVWIPEGFLVWRGSVRGSTLQVQCESDGIEELVSNDVVAPRGGEPVTAHWDRAIFWHGSGDAADALVHPVDRFQSAWDLDWSPADPSFIVAVLGDQRTCCRNDDDSYNSGYSTDGGRSWQRFSSYDSDHPRVLVYGNIAVSSSNTSNLVWLPTFNGAPHHSTDQGATWAPVELPGTEDMRNDSGAYKGGSHANYFLDRQVLAADRIAPDTFYLYHSDLGIFRSVDAGATWELQPSENLPTGWTVGHFRAQLVASPTTEGHLLFSPGPQNAGPVPAYESRDGGASWRALPGLRDVTTFAFGAAVAESESSAVYLYGAVDGATGLWRSVDDLESWELVAEYPGGNYQPVRTLAADLEEPGVVYVGFTGTSFMVGRSMPKNSS
jgi:photosystem II stability/assembly factor-like uncharacterized protein